MFSKGTLRLNPTGWDVGVWECIWGLHRDIAKLRGTVGFLRAGRTGGRVANRERCAYWRIGEA